jgi:hypothetical protein
MISKANEYLDSWHGSRSIKSCHGIKSQWMVGIYFLIDISDKISVIYHDGLNFNGYIAFIFLDGWLGLNKCGLL